MAKKAESDQKRTMAKSEESRQDANTSTRASKSSDVHKRRVDRKSRSGLAKLPKITKDDTPAKRRLARTLPSITAPSNDDAEQAAEAAMPASEEKNAPVDVLPAREQADSSEMRDPAFKTALPKAPSKKGESLQDVSDRDQNAKEESADTGRFRKLAAKPSLPKTKTILIVVAIIVVLGVCIAGFFAWNRWLRYDDHKDMQGDWYVAKSAVPVRIDAGSIYLTDDVTYQYEINAHDKTIDYTFGPMEGHGRYWFNDDRSCLAITDGEGYTAADTAFEDFWRAFEDFAVTSSGGVVLLPDGEGVIVLCRDPDPEALAKKEAEQREAAQRAAQEAREKEEAEAEAEGDVWDGASAYYYDYGYGDGFEATDQVDESYPVYDGYEDAGYTDDAAADFNAYDPTEEFGQAQWAPAEEGAFDGA